MKKMFCALCLGSFSFVVSVSAAQFGFKVGLNIAGVSGEYRVDSYRVDLSHRGGIRVGGFCSFDIAEGLQLQPEIYYTRKGASYEYCGKYYTLDYSISGNLQLDYIEIPLLVKYQARIGTLSPFLFTGPYLAFKTSARGGMTLAISGFDAVSESGPIEEIKPIDLGMVFGAGVRWPLGEVDLIFDARYSLGLSNLSDGLNEEMKNDAFSFLAGIAF